MSRAQLLLGPLLRYVDSTSATIWLETDRPSHVSIRTADQRWSEPTWSVHGHHFALVVLTDLEPGSATEYQVYLDDEPHWPPSESAFPPSVIRTFAPQASFRLTFGSCRRAAPMDPQSLRRYGADALVALAERMAHSEFRLWPDALYLGGDQVYADEPSDELLERLRVRRERGDRGVYDPSSDGQDGGTRDSDHETDSEPEDTVFDEIQTFEEYTWLYHESWTEPAVRWLLSTVPTVMMLDDHDLRDDWNTSQAWRERVTAQPWWRERVIGALGSYWVYQHLGNLSPSELAVDPLYRHLRTEADPDRRAAMLDDFAWDSDAQPAQARWSVARELGNEQLSIRFIALDTRCSRRLVEGDRAILDDEEWQWFRDRALADDAPDHLLVASTLPILLPPGIHELESWNEAVAEGVWGRHAARAAEWVRQAADLEHWAAFRTSLHRLCDVLVELAARPDRPAVVVLIGGDVHSSYLSRAHWRPSDNTSKGRANGHHQASSMPVVQLTMSPFRNPLELPIRVANRSLSWRPVKALLRGMRRAAGVDDLPMTWGIDEGIWFDNGLMTVVIADRQAQVEVEHAVVVADRQVLQRTYTGPLNDS